MLYTLAFLGGVAGLTWELLWMHHTGLHLGVSAQGAALTLVAFSLGTALGSVFGGRLLAKMGEGKWVLIWAALEVVLGLLGQGLAPGFAALAGIDGELFASSPGLAWVVQTLGLVLLLGLPAACMGATIPAFSAAAGATGVSLARMYAANIAGAACGVVFTSFVVIPAAGVGAAVDFASAVDIGIGLALYLLSKRVSETGDVDNGASAVQRSAGAPDLSRSSAFALVAASGFGTFALEVAWFRSIRAAFQATTEGFALMLFAVLLALSAGAAVAPRLRASGRVALGTVALVAAALVLVSTPLVERMDQFVLLFVENPKYEVVTALKLGLAISVLGPAMFCIGIILPWCLEAYGDVADASRLYAVNTASAVLGSLVAAWVLLPTIGFAASAWLSAAAFGLVGWRVSEGANKAVLVGLCGAAVIAVGARSEVGELRVQINGEVEHTVLASKEGPDATVSVIEHDDGVRFLVIDGFHATGTGAGEHYMAWMGHLPMMMVRDPENALVICFGTGQTSNAVRKEGPEHLDIADVSPSVFEMAPLFDKNEAVLEDERVAHHAMDGRAWLRRTATTYDVITLEPMPPTFAGSNALYSVEFYGLMRSRLSEQGAAAQWLPFHLVDPIESASIVASFLEVFPNAYLWIDSSGTGVLLGFVSPDPRRELFPGGGRNTRRGLTISQIKQGVIAGPKELAAYAQIGELITDDNQRLSYGFGRERWWRQGADISQTLSYQHDLLRAMAMPGPPQMKLAEFLRKNPHPTERQN